MSVDMLSNEELQVLWHATVEFQRSGTLSEGSPIRGLAARLEAPESAVGFHHACTLVWREVAVRSLWSLQAIGEMVADGNLSDRVVRGRVRDVVARSVLP